MKTIIEDKRIIKTLHFPDESIIQINNHVEKIEAYQEYGQMALVTWFAVYRKGKIDQRFNGAYVECIEYLENRK